MPNHFLVHSAHAARQRVAREAVRAYRVGLRVVKRFASEDAGTLAGGIAHFSLMALPALIIAFVAVYGLLTSPSDVWQQIDWLSQVVPAQAAGFLRSQMERAARASGGALSVAAIAGVAFALVSASNAVSCTIAGLNRIYRLGEQRGFLRRQALSLALTVAGFVLALALALLVALPGLASQLRWEGVGWELLRAVRWPLAFAIVSGLLAVFYLIAPCNSRIEWKHALVGGVIGAGLLLGVSYALSWFGTHVVDYQQLYGAFGGVVVVMLWFYLSAIALVVGGLCSDEASLPEDERPIRERDAPEPGTHGAR